MHIIRAIISLGLFGGLGWAVWTGQFDAASGGSSKSRALKAIVDNVTEQFGVQTTAIALVAVGIVLAMIFLVLHRRNQQAY